MLADTEFNELTGLNTILLPSLSENLLFQFDTSGDQPTGLGIREAAAARVHVCFTINCGSSCPQSCDRCWALPAM